MFCPVMRSHSIYLLNDFPLHLTAEVVSQHAIPSIPHTECPTPGIPASHHCPPIPCFHLHLGNHKTDFWFSKFLGLFVRSQKKRDHTVFYLLCWLISWGIMPLQSILVVTNGRVFPFVMAGSFCFPRGERAAACGHTCSSQGCAGPELMY